MLYRDPFNDYPDWLEGSDLAKEVTKIMERATNVLASSPTSKSEHAEVVTSAQCLSIVNTLWGKYKKGSVRDGPVLDSTVVSTSKSEHMELMTCLKNLGIRVQNDIRGRVNLVAVLEQITEAGLEKWKVSKSIMRMSNIPVKARGILSNTLNLLKFWKALEHCYHAYFGKKDEDSTATST